MIAAVFTTACGADSRLTNESPTGGYTDSLQHTYDNVGNRLSKSINGTQTQAFVYDADDRVTSYNGNTSAYSYDANGNVRSDGTNAYTWDWENQMTASGPVGGSANASYIYDADGLRIQQTTTARTTNYTIDADSGFGDVIEDRNQSGSLVARYDYGDDLVDMLRSAGTSWYLFDGHGSTMQLTNGSGTVTDSYEYEAYGNLLSRSGSTPIVYLYDGQEQDGTGLYYLRARYMDPARGEFLGQDPFRGITEDPVSLHRYLYCADQPVNNIDPGGADFGDDPAGLGLADMVVTEDLVDLGETSEDEEDVEAEGFASGEIDESGEALNLSGEDLDATLEYESDTVEGEYSPEKPGPLPERVASTFEGGRYTARVPNTETTLYRVVGDDPNAKIAGQYWSRVPPGDAASYRSMSAIKYQWNPNIETSKVVTMRLPPGGATMYDGQAGPQETIDPATGEAVTLPGGGNQVVFPNPGVINPGWLSDPVPFEQFVEIASGALE